MKHKNDKSMHNMIQPRASWHNGTFGSPFNGVSHLTVEGEKKEYTLYGSCFDDYH